jgi:hypothetical protein
MSDVTGLDKKGSLEAIFHFAIASDMYSSLGHIYKYISPKNLHYSSEKLCLI